MSGNPDGRSTGGSGPPAANSVTTVVMTRDRWDDLRRSLPHHGKSVIVIDNGSVDGTPELVAQHFPDVNVVALDSNIGAVARNIGVERARTPYVAFADDDSWWSPGALGLAARILGDNPQLGLLAARVLVGDDLRLDRVSAAMASSRLGHDPDLPGPSVLGFLACGAVVRRRAFLDVGGFDDVVEMYGEEERLAWDLRDAGWSLTYCEAVVAHHHPSLGPRSSHIRALLHRNRVLTSVMRRPWSSVARTVASTVHSREGRAGVRLTVPRLGAAMSRRRVVGPTVEAEIRRLEHVRPATLEAGSTAPGCGYSWEEPGGKYEP
jgi:GT2 family glycosyltransferase